MCLRCLRGTLYSVLRSTSYSLRSTNYKLPQIVNPKVTCVLCRVKAAASPAKPKAVAVVACTNCNRQKRASGQRLPGKAREEAEASRGQIKKDLNNALFTLHPSRPHSLSIESLAAIHERPIDLVVSPRNLRLRLTAFFRSFPYLFLLLSSPLHLEDAVESGTASSASWCFGFSVRPYDMHLTVADTWGCAQTIE